MVNRDQLALIATALVGIGFLVAGIFNVLDLLIVKAILFGAFATLVLLVIAVIISKSKEKENHQH